MRSSWQVKAAVVCGLMVFGLGLLNTPQQAEARPAYLKAFLGKYEEVSKEHEIKAKVKCGLCHVGKTKKKRNGYGEALGKAIGKKNEKDAKVITEALGKAEKEKSAVEKMTYGDLLKEGEMPNKGDKTKADDKK